MTQFDYISIFFAILEREQLIRHHLKTVLKRPVRFGWYRAFDPNDRRSRLATDQETMRPLLTHTIKSGNLNSVYYVTGRFRIK